MPEPRIDMPARRPRRRLVVAAVFLCPLVLLSIFFLTKRIHPPLPRRYTIEVIEPPAEYTGAEAEAINNLGETVGRFHNDTTASGGEAFVRFPTGVVEMLGVVLMANAINDSGQIAGVMETEASDFTPIAINIRERPHAILHPPGEQGIFCGNNDAGFSVGWLGGPGVCSATGEETWIEIEDREDGVASDISNRSVVVGTSRPMGREAYVWDATQGARYIPGVHPNVSEAHAINDRGDVVGYCHFDADRNHAFLWTEGADAVDLGSLSRFDSEANDINEHRQVVGSYDSTSLFLHLYQRARERFPKQFRNKWVQRLGLAPPTRGDREHRAFLWEEGTMYDLNTALPKTPDWGHLIEARGINDRGQIVGNGIYKGKQCGFVLTPVDNPEEDPAAN